MNVALKCVSGRKRSYRKMWAEKLAGRKINNTGQEHGGMEELKLSLRKLSFCPFPLNYSDLYV